MGPHKYWLSGFLLTVITHIVALPACGYVGAPHHAHMCPPAGPSPELNREPNNNTEAISVQGYQITLLDRDLLKSFNSSLKVVDISDNNIEELEHDIFNNVESLLYLNISRNLLSRLPVDLFVYTPHLLVLDLKENFIDYLDLGLFDSLKNLNTLDLSYNAFVGKNLNPRLFTKNKRIKFISFAGNDMNDTPKSLLQPVENLEKLDLSNCGVEDLPVFAAQPNLKTLKELILSSNQINRLDDENSLNIFENLEILNLAHNELEYVDENVLAPLRNLNTIIMSNNRLIYLPENLFRGTIFLENIDLSHNTITEVSVRTFLSNPVKCLNLSFNRFTYLPKDFCHRLRQLGANIAELYFHQNPWQCTCLKEMLNEVEDLNVTHKTDLPGYMKPVCLVQKDVTCNRDEISNSIFTEMYDTIKSVDPYNMWDEVRQSSV